MPAVPQVLARAASWRAARSGLDDRLIHPVTLRAAPAAEVVRALLHHVRPALEEHGDWATAAELTEALVRRGPSAQRQRAALRRGQALAGIVADLAAESVAG